MILLNFSHPLTPEHLDQLESLTGSRPEQVICVAVHVDYSRSLEDQASEIADLVGLSPYEWQTLQLLVNLPGYAPAAAALLAELHGRIGFFPEFLWITPVEGSVPTRFKVADVVKLRPAREAARLRR